VVRYPVLNSHGKPTGGYYVDTMRYTVYRVLKGAAASTQLLSLQHAHPTAKVVVGQKAYVTAQDRLHVG
jgi:hypothetical protein